MTATELASRFFLAAATILLVCRGVRFAVARVGQPPVVGEMIAGVLLGPSLLGAVWPAAEHALFPQSLRPMLYVAGQIGLVALMFQAGRELRAYLSRGLALTAGTISAFGVACPLGLGIGLTYAVRGHVPVFAPGVSADVTAAFVGVALSITAFPMLARIIIERGLSASRHGSISLACGAVDDVVAWIMLAAVLSVASNRTWPIVEAIGGAALFAAVLVWVVRPAVAWYLRRPEMGEHSIVLATLTLVFIAAWFTDEIGLYAVFGAFSVGMIMPRGPAVERTVPTTDAVTRVFVPMFFTYSGLNTRFGLLTDPRVLLFALAAVLAAIAGKFGACWLAARIRGESGQTAAQIGALMNARGLMQLIALNIGLQAHIVTGALFTSLVLVALVTTVMTAPLLSYIDRRGASVRAATPPGGEPARVEATAADVVDMA